MKKSLLGIVSAIALSFNLNMANAEESVLRDDAPETYVVAPGDNLWDISRAFLKKPSQWPALWYANEQIENPNLIYPGDVIRIEIVEGEPRFQVDTSQRGQIGRSTKSAQPEPAQSQPAMSNEALRAHVQAKLAVVDPRLVIKSIEQSEADGLYRMSFEQGGSVYLVPSGEHFLAGKLFHIGENEIVNIEQERMRAKQRALKGPRKAMIAAISPDEMITFSPEGEVKTSVVVFTDVECYYCRKLHLEVPRLNELGIEVKYMAYPRAGVGSSAYKKLASAWCAENPQEALTTLKQEKEIPENVCKGNPVAKQMNLALEAGLNGTPGIIFEDGELHPGYLPADQLAMLLGVIQPQPGPVR